MTELPFPEWSDGLPHLLPLPPQQARSEDYERIEGPELAQLLQLLATPVQHHMTNLRIWPPASGNGMFTRLPMGYAAFWRFSGANECRVRSFGIYGHPR